MNALHSIRPDIVTCKNKANDLASVYWKLVSIKVK